MNNICSNHDGSLVSPGCGGNRPSAEYRYNPGYEDHFVELCKECAADLRADLVDYEELEKL